MRVPYSAVENLRSSRRMSTDGTRKNDTQYAECKTAITSLEMLSREKSEWKDWLDQKVMEEDELLDSCWRPDPSYLLFTE